MNIREGLMDIETAIYYSLLWSKACHEKSVESRMSILSYKMKRRIRAHPEVKKCKLRRFDGS